MTAPKQQAELPALVRVPVDLPEAVFKAWRIEADRLGTDVGPLLAGAASKVLRTPTGQDRARKRTRYKRLTVAEVEHGKKMRQAGYSWNAIARELECSPGAIRYQINGHRGPSTPIEQPTSTEAAA